MLYYLPLEAYPERYTSMMSCKDGWAEDRFKKLNVPFTRVEGKQLNKEIQTGVVLDACGRSYYASTQIAALVQLINEGKVKDGDVVYTEDFWTPSIESLFYIRHLMKIDFKIGCFLHAQSVDDTDFSYSMREWMRPIEIGYGRGYDFIFVCSPILKRLCVEAGVGTDENIHVVGLPYNSTRLLEQLETMGFQPQEKEDYVIFSSRFDDEKDPMFFLDLVERCPDIQFRLVNPRKGRSVTSNPDVLKRLDEIQNKEGSNFKIIDTSNKVDYYTALAKAKVQFNCAHQDWVSWTLLEAVTFGCNVLYPKWKDFPLELNYNEEYLYTKRDLNECEEKLRALMTKEHTDENTFIRVKHDNSWASYLRIMNLI